MQLRSKNGGNMIYRMATSMVFIKTMVISLTLLMSSCQKDDDVEYDLSSYFIMRYDGYSKAIGYQGGIISKMDNESFTFYSLKELNNDYELLKHLLVKYELPNSYVDDENYIEIKLINSREDELRKFRAVKQDLFIDIDDILSDLKLKEKKMPLSNIRLKYIRFLSDTIYLNSPKSVLLATDLMSDFSINEEESILKSSIDIGFETFDDSSTNPISAISIGHSNKTLIIKYEDGDQKVYNIELTKSLYSYSECN